ncbi:hypothetical protein K7W42_02405 [Deinococcus sp. HMF7604]|uniref:hypothetical protein n=1 Tax=Deinococcus betulae TaxID=2873312 RepID=UPI001CCB6ED7|nr:hypothetical protein [Deinococcus betulae]MBZ9749710.1 hypothetical protein [Deinococcus betulae]
MTRPEETEETYRGPPPSVSAAVLILGVMGTIAGFSALTLLLPSDHRPLCFIWALTPFIGLIWAGVRYVQVRGHQVRPEIALAVPLAVAWVPFIVSGPALRAGLSWMDRGMLLMAAGTFLFAMLLSLHIARRLRA